MAGVSVPTGTVEEEDDEEDEAEEEEASVVDSGNPAPGMTSAGGGDGESALSSRASIQRRNQPFGKIAANVAFTSDYIFRGRTMTEHGPAIQGGLDWTHWSGFYLGVWGSNVRSTDGPATVELDFLGGYTYRFTRRLSVSLGVLHYAYFRGGEGNAWDIPLKLNYRSFKLEASYTPKFGGAEGHGWYVSAGWSDTVFAEVALGLNAGYSFFSKSLELNNYADFRISLSRTFLGVDWELASVFVDRRQFDGGDDPRLVFTASRSF